MFILLYYYVLAENFSNEESGSSRRKYLYNSTRCSLGRCRPKKIVNLGHSETDENKNQASSARMLPNDSEKYEDYRQENVLSIAMTQMK